jgi:hypothetical protein
MGYKWGMSLKFYVYHLESLRIDLSDISHLPIPTPQNANSMPLMAVLGPFRYGYSYNPTHQTA